MWILALAFLLQAFCTQTAQAQSSLLDQGNQALDAKDYDRAISLFTQAAKTDPKDSAAEFQLALTYSLLGKDREAIPHYQQALTLEPGLYEAELNLALSLVRARQSEEAIPHFRAASEKRPMEFRPALGLAQALLENQKYPEAEAAFQKALQINSRSAAAEAGLGMALGRQNKVDEAATHFQQAFTWDRTYRASFVELALLYEANHRTKEAITFYRMFPDNPVALEHLGVLLTEAGELPDAIKALEGAVEKTPTTERRIALAQAYLANKQLDKAQLAVEPAVESNPKDVELRMFYGRLLRDQRKFPDAAAQFAAVTRLQPDSKDAWNELANVLMISEQFAQGLEALDRRRALGGESAGNLYYRALAQDHLRQAKDAIVSYQAFLAAAQGKFPDQEFQARQRIKNLESELRKR